VKGLRTVFGCDLRSLAAFRVGLGLALLFDLFGRSRDLEAHYTDTGVLPRDLLFQTTDSFVLSLHVLGGSVAFEVLLFALAGMAAVLLVLGWNTRWVAITSWIFLASLHARNPMVLDPGDNLLLTLCFLGMFLPIGRQYSIDSAMDPEPVSDNRHCSLATVLLLLLTMLMIFLVVRSFPETNAVWAAGIALLAFMPTILWDWMGAHTELASHGGLRIYFDKDCVFCRKICLLFRTFLVLLKTNIRAAQEVPEAYEIMVEHDSWVVYDYDGQVYVRWHAVLLLLRRSPLAWPVGYLLTAIGMGRWGDFLYGLIASARSPLSKLTSVLLPYRKHSIEKPAIANVLLGLYLLFVLTSGIFQQLSWNMPGAEMLQHALPSAEIWRSLGEAGPQMRRDRPDEDGHLLNPSTTVIRLDRRGT
jgi:predicted DCC family thiol-disulfide oxidoreductase YuxK